MERRVVKDRAEARCRDLCSRKFRTTSTNAWENIRAFRRNPVDPEDPAFEASPQGTHNILTAGTFQFHVKLLESPRIPGKKKPTLGGLFQ